MARLFNSHDHLISFPFSTLTSASLTSLALKAPLERLESR